MTSDEVKNIVSDAGRELISRGLAARTWGNISCRVDGHTIAVTPSGMAYDLITPDDIVLVDIYSGEVFGRHKPSSELLIHTELYKYDCDVNAIIHTHQTFATAIGLTGMDGLPKKTGIAGYALPGTVELANNVNRAFLNGFRTVLMPHHGAVFAGENMNAVFESAERFELFCSKVVACKTCELKPDPAHLAAALRLARSEFKYCAAGTSKYALAAAESCAPVPAQLDDAAMMFGDMIPAAPFEDILSALRRYGAVLIKGVGVICASDDESDAESKAVLAEKACLCYLHTAAVGVSAKLDDNDIKELHESYISSYSKRLRG